MGNSEENYSQALMNSPILRITEALELNKDFTVLDKVLVNRILIGCTKMMSAIRPSYIKKMAKSKRAFSQYDIGMSHLLAILLITRKQGINQSAIRDILQDLKSIQQSDIYEFSNFIVKMGLKIKRPVEVKRGRPTDVGIGGEKRRGPRRVSFEDTKYMILVRNLLSKGSVRNLIYCYFFESTIFYYWIYSMVLLFLYNLKYGGPQASKKLSKILVKKFDKTADIAFQKLYEEHCLLGDEELDEKASKLSREIARSYTDDIPFMRYFFSYTCMLGAFLYPYPITLEGENPALP